MFINLSNHPSNIWSPKQINAVKKNFDNVIDIQFPDISPYATTNQVIAKAEKYFVDILKIIKNSTDRRNAVHLMGEFTFVYHLAFMLKKKKIPVVASTTKRLVEEKGGKKIVTFNFVKFREY